ncbi:hypothetical protein CYMTET_36344, partial [Cymbomonas tetramitiformis]
AIGMINVPKVVSVSKHHETGSESHVTPHRMGGRLLESGPSSEDRLSSSAQLQQSQSLPMLPHDYHSARATLHSAGSAPVNNAGFRGDVRVRQRVSPFRSQAMSARLGSRQSRSASRQSRPPTAFTLEERETIEGWGNSPRKGLHTLLNDFADTPCYEPLQ